MKLKRAHGCRGHLQFAFSSVHADPWYDLDGREDEQVAAFFHPGDEARPFRRSMDLMLYREAITDYRYLRALELALNAASQAGLRAPEVVAAQGWFDATLAKMEVGSDAPQPWSRTELDAVRAQAAAHMTRLVKLGG